MAANETIHPARLDPVELLKQCEVRRLRRSGPGGQRRNKVETAVVLRHVPTGIDAEANERRSPLQNQRVALSRLRINLALAFRSQVVAEIAPSVLWKSRCRGGRIVVSRDHRDYPSILSEALDVVLHYAADLQAAAELLGCTASQLTKLLRSEPRALTLVNARRAELGLKRLN